MRMRGSELVEAMAAAVDRIVSVGEGTGTPDRTIKAIVEMIGWFSGKDVTKYLEAYRTEMIMRDVPREWRLYGPTSGDAEHPRGGAQGTNRVQKLGGV